MDTERELGEMRVAEEARDLIFIEQLKAEREDEFCAWFNEVILQKSGLKITRTEEMFPEIKAKYWLDYEKSILLPDLVHKLAAKQMAKAVRPEMGVYHECFGA